MTAHSEFLSAIHALPWLCRRVFGFARVVSRRLAGLLFVCLTRKTSAFIGRWFSTHPIEPLHERGVGSRSRSVWVKATLIVAFSLCKAKPDWGCQRRHTPPRSLHLAVTWPFICTRGRG